MSFGIGTRNAIDVGLGGIIAFATNPWGGSAFDGAAAAYSTRIPAGGIYGGPLLRVRRSSDNAEQDIYASAIPDANGNRFLDTTALLAFAGVNSAFVTTWYDQSGNGRHATQTTTAAQPRIVNAGVIDTTGGLPAVVFNGSQWIITPTILSRTTYPNAFVNCVYQNTLNSGTQSLWGGDGDWARFQLLSFAAAPSITYGLATGVAATPQTALLANTNRNVYTFASQTNVTNGSNIFVNGVAGTAITETNTGIPTALTIGAIFPGGLYPMVGSFQEFVYGFYTPSATQRQALERNQGTAFGITVA